MKLECTCTLYNLYVWNVHLVLQHLHISCMTYIIVHRSRNIFNVWFGYVFVCISRMMYSNMRYARPLVLGLKCMWSHTYFFSQCRCFAVVVPDISWISLVELNSIQTFKRRSITDANMMVSKLEPWKVIHFARKSTTAVITKCQNID